VTQVKLLFFWLTLAALPVAAQTAASVSDKAHDQTSRALPDAPAATAQGAYGVDTFSLQAFRVDPLNFAATGTGTEGLPGGSRTAAGTPALTQAPAQPQTSEPAAAPPASDALTWHGMTVYGAYDVGFGWVSHGLPENGYNYEGASLVNRNGYEHRFVLAPNNLQQTGFGVRGKIEFTPGWYAVFNASTGLNPQSGLLANAFPGPATPTRSTERAPASPSMTNTMAVSRTIITAR
jgi:hypothetical protein